MLDRLGMISFRVSDILEHAFRLYFHIVICLVESYSWSLRAEFKVRGIRDVFLFQNNMQPLIFQLSRPCMYPILLLLGSFNSNIVCCRLHACCCHFLYNFFSSSCGVLIGLIIYRL